MRILLRISLLAILFTAPEVRAQLFPNLGGQRAGISGLQFLKIGVGGRGAGMGESFVAVADDASALFWNPAGIVEKPGNAVILSHGEWLVGLKHNFAGAVYQISGADAVGISLVSLMSDDMKITTELQPFGTGEYFKYSDLAIGATYARKMTDQFSFGATIRYVEENLDVLKIRTVLFDLGTFYTMGLGSARFGVVVANFGADIEPTGTVTLLSGATVNSFQSFSPPTMFKLAFAFEPYQDEIHRITTNIQLNHPNDNAENVRLGMEYAFDKWIFLRGGIKRTIGEPLLAADRKSADNYSFGIGAYMPAGFTDLMFDYAYTDFGVLGAVHRISLSMKLLNGF